ncbi:glycosyltransferase [Halorubrum sp. JWXQ-INN 858]|uniref:glycosyltransferase n=1 Tax=Halorubrum sp. JWXQ-INN 858 TaxID=2690782 RepID=UPI00135BCA61|nr:glycosyltransferase [Halorubrum sp. JWXQ-INN 858]MWV65236.1 glycosyltransferase [Halorubrum sp. JWXQ-INN 858]
MVLWIYPDAISEWKSENKNGLIREITVPTQCGPVRLRNRLIDRPVFKSYFKREIESKIRQFLGEKTVLWYYSPQFSFLCENRDLWDAIIYDCSDNHTTTGWKYRHEKGILESYRDRISALFSLLNEKKILDHTDIVFASSEYLYDKLKAHTTAPIHLEETGVDLDKFNAKETYDQIEEFNRPRLGFVGKLKKKIDYQVLDGIAKSNPSWNVILVGPRYGVDIDHLLETSNVTWIGAVEPHEVPKVMNSLDVGLMPYREIEYNEAVFPLKFHEYLASGLPVVGCGLPSTDQWTQNGVYIHTSAQSSDFSNACDEALSWETNKNIRKEIAAQADWSSKLDRIYHRVLDTIHFDTS